jgi:hypothetical protein
MAGHYSPAITLAGPGREPIPVREPGNITDVGQNRRGGDGSDTGQVQQPRASCQHYRPQLLGEGVDLLEESIPPNA